MFYLRGALVSVIAIGTVFLTLTPVRAQGSDPLMQLPTGNPVAPLVRRFVEAPKTGVEKPAPGATPSTRFKRSGTRIYLPKLVARIAKTDAQKKTLTQVLEDGMQAYEKDATEAGTANDVAASAVYFLTTQWSVTNNGKPAPETGHMIAVVQLQRAMDSPELKKATDAQKQEFYEWCVCTGALMALTSQVAEEGQDTRMASRLKQSAGEGIKNLLGVEAGQVGFNSTGMEIRAANSEKKPEEKAPEEKTPEGKTP